MIRYKQKIVETYVGNEEIRLYEGKVLDKQMV